MGSDGVISFLMPLSASFLETQGLKVARGGGGGGGDACARELINT